jgi:hypothetical protein
MQSAIQSRHHRRQDRTKTQIVRGAQLSLLVTLQNAYGANAKIISAIQDMYTQLLQAVQ